MTRQDVQRALRRGFRRHVRRHIVRAMIAFACILLPVIGCVRLLGLPGPGPRRFEHRAHVLEGVSCTECHDGIESAGERGPLHLPNTERCLSCHQTPHDPRPCMGCHGTPYTALDLAQAREHLRFGHDRHLARQHGNCVSCHRGVAHDDSRLRPTMATCLACHAHDDQFELRQCDACHVDLPAELTRPESHLIHGADFVREHGARAASAADLCATCHKDSFCAGCHGATTALLPARLAFDQPDRLDLHRAGFMARHGEQARAFSGLCITCHSERSCRDCHVARGVAFDVVPGPDNEPGSGTPGDGTSVQRSPHPPGWVGVGTSNRHGRAARRDPASCASCHGGAGEALCIECHRVGGIGGNPHPPGWSSRKRLSEVPCRGCHIGGL